MLIKIKLLEGGRMPEKATPGAAAFDCFARIDYHPAIKERVMFVDDKAKIVPLGFAIELPPGYHAEIYPRSSTGLKTKLRVPNSVGIIDSDYRGEVGFICENTDFGVLGGDYHILCGRSYAIRNGDRIAQMIIKKNEEVKLAQVDKLSETERGAGGFGSTGR